LGRALGIPVRDCAPGVAFLGDFYGQTPHGEALPDAIGVESLLRLLKVLPVGITELVCHPAVEPEPDSTYSVERPQELETLCDPRVKAGIEAEGIELRSFADLGAAAGGVATLYS
jgi:predicted glycoside hydrolase/deacetylase ChbG (UPF0249 family)